MTTEQFEKLKFDLWMGLNAVQHADWFNAHLFRLFCKADLSNRRRLAQGFPDEAEVFNAWWSHPDEREFYGPELIARAEKARQDLMR